MHSAATIWHRMPLTLGLVAALGPATAAYAAYINNQSFDQVERGRYLSIVGDCAACHTLPGSGHALAGGRALETPFGSLLSPNITPDAVTGIGAWTDDEFVNAMTKGTGRNGTHLFPAMPYTYYTKISRDEALAIRAYLNTLPAVHNEVRADQLPFPLNVRENLVAWDRLFFKPGEYLPDPGKSAEWNRGAYLTEGLGHCGLCHTPKNELGGDERDRAMQGYVLQGWFAADLTNDRRRGLGSWSVDDIATYLKTGVNKHASATGLMAETINDFDIEDERRRPARDRRLSERPARRSRQRGAKSRGHGCAGPSGFCHEDRPTDLRRRMRGLPQRRRQRHFRSVPRLGGSSPRATKRSRLAPACGAARHHGPRDAAGADGCRDAGLRLGFG